jgi:hypothetical protein
MARRFTLVIALLVVAVVAAPIVRAADTDTPKGTAQAFFKALEAGDSDKAKALATGDEKQMKMLDLLVPLVGNFKKMEQSAVKKWGDEGKKILQGDGPGANPTFDMEAELKDAKIEEKGDTATITPTKKAEGKDNDPMKLKKVAGKWKIDMAAMPNSDGMDDPNAQKVLKGMGDIAKAMAGEIDQGKYKSVVEAKQAFQQKMVPLIFGALGQQPPGQPGAPGQPGQPGQPKGDDK